MTSENIKTFIFFFSDRVIKGKKSLQDSSDTMLTWNIAAAMQKHEPGCRQHVNSPILQPSWREQIAPSRQLSQCLATTDRMRSIKGKIRQGTDEASGKNKTHWSITLLLCSYLLNNCALLARVSGRKKTLSGINPQRDAMAPEAANEP